MAIQKLNNNTTQSQGVVTPKPNLLEVVQDGYITITPRNASITLTTTNVGYKFRVIINTGIDIDEFTFLQVPPMVDVRAVSRLTDANTGEGIIVDSYELNNSSGLWASDGTNSVWYHYSARTKPTFYAETNVLCVELEFTLRVISGSWTLNPLTFFGGEVYYRIINQASTTGETAGSGGAGTGDGKYIYNDIVMYDNHGLEIMPLASTLDETTNGDYKYYPRPISHSPNTPGITVA